MTHRKEFALKTMDEAKTAVDMLILGGDVITMNAAGEVVTDGALAIQGSRIVAVGSAVDLRTRYEAPQVIDASKHIVMPGLIDTHTHTAQQFERSLVKWLGRKRPFKEPVWQTLLFPFEASLTEEDMHLSGLFTYANMLKLGTTTFADSGGPCPEALGPAIEQTGIRGVLARSTVDATEGIPPEMTDTVAGIIEKGERLYGQWHGKADGRIRVWMGMRQIMVCSEDLLHAVRGLADQFNTGIHIHLAEGPYEVDWAIIQAGQRPTEYLAARGFLGPGVHAAHSVMLSERELDLYEANDVSVGHCPVAMFSYTGVAKVPEMRRRKLRVGLGSDGAAFSGGSLDLFQQMKMAYHTHSVVYGMPYREISPVTQEDMLDIATLGGARALRWEDEIGSLEVGKKADVILLNCDDLDVLPSYDPLHTASSVASGAQVRTVIVNGNVVVRDGKLLTLDEAALRERVRERAPKIVERFLKRVN